MWKAIETENVIKNIIREIVRKCSDDGVSVPDILAQYVVKLTVLNPSYGFISDNTLQREDVERMVQICSEKLSQDTPSLATLKMQVHFDTYFAPRDQIIAHHQLNLKKKADPVIKEIVELTTKTRDGFQKLYKKIIIAIVIYSGLGNPTSKVVLKETSVALQSVFPISQLEQFISFSHKEKEQQVIELAQIVAGIRLFNRDCQKGGEGIDDLPVILHEAANSLQENIKKSLEHMEDLINLLTVAVENCLKRLLLFSSGMDEVGKILNIDASDISEEDLTLKVQKGHKFLESGQNETKKEMKQVDINEDDYFKDEKEEETDESSVKTITITWKDLELVKDSLVAAHQHEVYLRKLLEEVDLTNSKLQIKLDLLQQQLIKIHEIVRFRTAIPTNEIYPEFIKLSEEWAGLQDELVLLSNISNIYWNLHSFMKVLENIDQDLLDELVGDSPILTNTARLEATAGLSIDPAAVICEVAPPSDTPDFDSLPVQYAGFCAGMLVFGKGALIPANPKMGLCLWKGLYYAFSSLEQAYAFGAYPEEYVNAALNLVRIKPELIKLLQVQEQIAMIKHIGGELRTQPRTVETVVKRHCEVQTELHPIPTYIDPNYEWNEWQLKRDAIKLANICRSATHSTQTYQSHHRSTIGSQTAIGKEVSCQTRRDGSSNVPKLGRYLFGLRGRTDDQQYDITLTRPH